MFVCFVVYFDINFDIKHVYNIMHVSSFVLNFCLLMFILYYT